MAIIIQNSKADPSPVAAGPNHVTITFQGKSDSPNSAVKVDFTVSPSPDYTHAPNPDSGSFDFTDNFQSFSHTMTITAIAQPRKNGLVTLRAKEISTGSLATDNAVI